MFTLHISACSLTIFRSCWVLCYVLLLLTSQLFYCQKCLALKIVQSYLGVNTMAAVWLSVSSEHFLANDPFCMAAKFCERETENSFKHVLLSKGQGKLCYVLIGILHASVHASDAIKNPQWDKQWNVKVRQSNERNLFLYQFHDSPASFISLSYLSSSLYSFITTKANSAAAVN